MLDRKPAVRDVFIDDALAFDRAHANILRATFESRLGRSDLHHAYYLLALWRLRAGGVSTLDEAQREQAHSIVAAYLHPPGDKIKRLIAIFKQTRQLVYLSLHNKLKDARHQVADLRDSELKDLFPLDATLDESWFRRGRWAVYDAMARHDALYYFASPEAAIHVLAHVEAYKTWSNSKFVDAAEVDVVRGSIDALFVRPEDWPDERPQAYQPFATLELPARVDWLTEVRLWLRDHAMLDPWSGANFLLTPTPHSDRFQLEIYRRDSGISIGALRHTVVQLSRAFGFHENATSASLWQSAARLVSRCFRSTLAEGYTLRLRPTAGVGSHAGYACVGDRYEFVRGMAKSFMANCNNEQRLLELRQTLAVADRQGHDAEPCIMLLATLEVVRDSDGKIMTDVDGLVGFLTPSGLKWLVVETKKIDSQDGERQLRDHLLPALAQPPTEIHHIQFNRQDAWYFTMNMPGPFH